MKKKLLLNLMIMVILCLLGTVNYANNVGQGCPMSCGRETCKIKNNEMNACPQKLCINSVCTRSDCQRDLCSQNCPNKLLSEKTTQYFTDEAVPEEDITSILQAGINATSGMNKQNWFFSAISNKDLMKEFKEKVQANMPDNMKGQKNAKAQFGDSPLAIVVSCIEGNELDAGLATQKIFDYAVILGYGAKIVSSPCKMINENYKEKLSVPKNMNSVAVVLIGKPKDMTGVDGITSASKRKDFAEVAKMLK